MTIVNGPLRRASRLLMASLVVLGVTASARAGVVINIDPTGGGGANPNDVLAASSFAYLPGNALAVGSIPLVVGADTHVLYQAILGSINTAGGNSASLDGNSGNITVNSGGGPVNTGVQFVITAEFTEKVTGIFSGGGFVTATFAPDLSAGTNEVKIYAQSSTNANLNDPNATNKYGVAGATLIMSGHLTSDGFTSAFTGNLATYPTFGGTPIALNQHGSGSGDYAGVQTIRGSGNTSVLVAVDSFKANYFLTAAPVLGLDFNTISSGTPFTGVDPALTMFNGHAPNVGAVNGDPHSGPDFLFQSQANNDFQVPEPATLMCASLGLFGGLGYARYRRKRVTS